MPELCPHCQQPIRKPRPRLVSTAPDVASMDEAQMRAYYKKTDRMETLRFWLRHLESGSQELRDAFTAFAFIVQNTKVPTDAFDRQFETLKGLWRREANTRDRLAHLAAGDVLVDNHWQAADTVAIVPTVFADSEVA